MVFRIIEIGNKKGLTRWLYGVILEKTEFIKQYFDDKKSVLDLDKDRVGCLDQLKFSHYHRVYVKQEKRVRGHMEKKHIDQLRMKQYEKYGKYDWEKL
jgi:hypothetical protein